MGRQYDEVGSYGLWRFAQLKINVGSIMETRYRGFQQVYTHCLTIHSTYFKYL